MIPRDGAPSVVAAGADVRKISVPVDGQPADAYRVVAFKGDAVVAVSALGTGEPSAKAGLNGRVAKWSSWARLAPHDPDQKSAVGEKQDSVEDGIHCTRQQYKVTRTPDEIIMFDPNLNSLWPGCIVRSDQAIKNGFLADAGIEPADRAPIGISIDSNAGGGSQTVKKPNLGDVHEAIRTMVEGKKGGARDILYRKTEGYSSAEVALEVGISAKYGGTSGSINIEAKRKHQQNTLVVYLRERAFTASCNLGKPESYIADSFTEEKLMDLISNNYMGPDNPPLIVSNVIYGRILMFSFTSTATETEINATLHASYNGFADVDATMKAKYQEIIQNSSIELISRGGPAEPVREAIYNGKISEYFSKDSPNLDQYGIMGYTLHTLDGLPAKMSETTDYGRISWGAADTYKVTLNLGDVYMDITGRGDWLYAKDCPVTLDGREFKVSDDKTATATRQFDGHGNGQEFRFNVGPDANCAFGAMTPHGMGWFTNGETAAAGHWEAYVGPLNTGWRIHYWASRS
ncbi:thiol-activated cytolysin family protein [Streptomyces sp. NPDC058734]|uniref:thiol-activated cytolysin family protein n=1 Tax=Streptomyces sp. NPDC058734 TaxID=3346615 RepID=UPI0036949C99